MKLEEEKLRQALMPLLQKHYGQSVQIEQCQRLTAGASAATWMIRLADDVPTSLILRLNASEQTFGTGVGKVLEAQTQQAAFKAGVPVAEVIEIIDQHPVLGKGYLMQCLQGETIPRRLLRDDHYQQARKALGDHCARALAGIHAIDVEKVAALPAQGAHEQLDQLQAIHRSFGEKLPVFELAFRWLRKQAPNTPSLSLVHGDFRLGNFMVDEQGLVAVLDWELTHLGDPMEDIGWLCVNAWRFGSDLPAGGFASRDVFYQAYSQYSGRAIDPQQVRYWEVFGNLKWGVICQFQAYTHLYGQVRSVERAAIGRRVAETERDILVLLQQ